MLQMTIISGRSIIASLMLVKLKGSIALTYIVYIRLEVSRRG